jgi:hypothetical protein
LTNKLFDEFSRWTDRILLEYAGRAVAAYNFNLYEHEDAFAIQLIGASRFDESDSDWACDEVFSSGEDLFELPHSIVSADWREGLRHATGLVEQYLERGKLAPRLKLSQAVGIGFVSGDLEIIYSLSDR